MRGALPAALACALWLGAGPAAAQVRLKSGTVEIDAGTTAALLRALEAMPGGALHGLATFSRHPSAQERKALEASGLALLAPLQGTTYRVRAARSLDARALALPGLAVTLSPLLPRHRVAPALWDERYERFVIRPPGEPPRNYVLDATGVLHLSVRLHAGTPQALGREVLERHARAYTRHGDHVWVASVRRERLRALAAEDVVQWIDAGPLPFLPENDVARAAINVDALQDFDPATGLAKGLTGRGVQVGLFDFGLDETHGDLAPSVVRNDNGARPHATHLAGVIAGSGALSAGLDSWGRPNGGAAFQWRGMAPGAQLIDADQAQGADPAVHLDYISGSGMDLSNHSYPVGFDGVYGESEQRRDELVRGDAASEAVPVPGRLHVYSAGNGGVNPEYGGSQRGYFALTKQVKNGLVVGNWDMVSGRIDGTSSLGPAHDGRIKPDVVAPGRSVASSATQPAGGLQSTGFCSGMESPANENCRDASGALVPRQNFYRLGRGTSMAAAATTGALALILERYAATYGVNLDQAPPLPSTLRALLIHTARDQAAAGVWFSNADGPVQATPGPDFVTGWGLIDAQAAVDVVAARALREAEVGATCDAVSYLFRVAAGTPGPVRVTLAWDDAAADAATDDTAPRLVNDLDLVLVDPSGTTHYPWQLDQRIVDALGNGVPDEQQLCGMALSVQRAVQPAASGDEVVPATGIAAAGRGRDRLNNVEVVDAPAVAGVWQARVSGFQVSAPQRFSLVGAVPGVIVAGNPWAICREYRWLCPRVEVWASLCIRFPAICEARIRFRPADPIRIAFADLRQRLVLPLGGLCGLAVPCPPCAAAGRCERYELEASATGARLRLEVFSAAGRPVARAIASPSAGRLKFRARRGESYVLVLGPAADPAEADLSLRVR